MLCVSINNEKKFDFCFFIYILEIYLISLEPEENQFNFLLAYF